MVDWMTVSIFGEPSMMWSQLVARAGISPCKAQGVLRQAENRNDKRDIGLPSVALRR
jgi:hypothetical protein